MPKKQDNENYYVQEPLLPQRVIPLHHKGVGGSNLGLAMKGGVAKVGSIGLVGKSLGAAGLLGTLVGTSSELINSLQEGEGYAAIPGLVVDLLTPDQEQEAEPIALADTPEIIAERQGFSNIPPAEEMVNNPMSTQK